MDAKKTGDFIALMRNENGLSQADLASRIGISSKVIAQWESGKGLPDPSVWRDLSGSLGIGVNELLLGEKSETPMEAGRISDMLVDTVLRERKNNRKRRRKFLLVALLVGFLLGVFLHRYAFALIPSSDPATTILRYSTLHGYSYTEGHVTVEEGHLDPDLGQQYAISGLTCSRVDPPCFFYLEKGAFGFYVVKSCGTGP